MPARVEAAQRPTPLPQAAHLLVPPFCRGKRKRCEESYRERQRMQPAPCPHGIAHLQACDQPPVQVKLSSQGFSS